MRFEMPIDLPKANQQERKAAPQEAAQGGSGSVLARCVLHAIDGFFASVLSVPGCCVGSTFYLINLTFRFKFLVASDVPSSFFNVAHGLICSTLDVFFVHMPPL